MHFDRLFLILRNMDYSLRPGGATTAADWIMPFLTVCKRRIRLKRFIKRQVNWFRKYRFMTNFGCMINNLKMIWLVYLLRNKIKFDFDFPFFLFSTWHCRVAIQFEYCFSIIGLYKDIYGYGMLSMGFWLLSKGKIWFILDTK